MTQMTPESLNIILIGLNGFAVVGASLAR